MIVLLHVITTLNKQCDVNCKRVIIQVLSSNFGNYSNPVVKDTHYLEQQIQLLD